METKKITREDVTLKGSITTEVPKWCLRVGFMGLLISFLFYFVDPHHFYFSYLTTFVFFLTITLGSLFFVLILHLTRAGWGIVVRRVAEHLMKNIGLMAILFLPLLFGMHDLYHWTHADAVAHDHLLKIKVPFLNIPFFFIRMALYIWAWLFLAGRFFKFSVAQDESGDSSLTLILQKTAAYGILIYGMTQSFAFIDLVMSITPHWYSTIFGVYYFAGSTMSALIVISLTCMFLRRYGFLKDIITVEHYHDLGKLIYGFMIFWSYIAFSQFFLIWYANIPEETVFYKMHFTGSWNWIAILLCVGHFGIPFVGFMSRHIKRNLKTHCMMAIWLLFMHYVDMYWVIMPNITPAGLSYSLLDFSLLIGMGGLYFSVFFTRLKKYPLIPVKDPRLGESLKFKNY